MTGTDNSRGNLVVIGQGYVGLPLAMAAAEAGYLVTGYDLDPQAVGGLNGGVSHIGDVSDEQLASALAAGYTASNDESVLGNADVIVICVPTPLSPDGGPDLSAVRGACNAVAKHFRSGALIILESTTYPGTTDGVVLPILEAHGRRHGEDFHLAFSPERVDPGNPQYGIVNTPKLVGGIDPAATVASVEFYSAFIDQVVPLSGTREAEMAKLLENTYRHVNIALVNEMARFCHDLGVDIWEVIRGAATKPFGFQAFKPGPGVGGHCIPIDPNYLSHEVKRQLGYSFRFVELAQEINSTVPRYIAGRVQSSLNRQGKALKGARVVLLGITYKANVADLRETPAKALAEALLAGGAEVSFYDPHVDGWMHTVRQVSGSQLRETLASCDIAVLLQAHEALDLEAIGTAASAILDCRGVMKGDNVERL